MADRLYRNYLRTLGAPEDPVATDTSSPWSAMSLLKAVFNSIGDLADHASDPVNAHAASAISFTPAGTGAVERTVQSKLQYREIDLLDYVPQNLIAGITLRTTTTDLTTCVQAAVNALVAEYGGGVLRYPAGLLIHGPIYIPHSDVHIAGQGKFVTTAKLKNSPLADQCSLFAFGLQSNKTTIVAVENIGASDMEIDGNKANQLQGTGALNGINAGIGTWRTKRLTLKNLVVHDCDGYGLGLVGTDVADRSDFSIEDVECYANTYDGIDIKGGTTNKPMRLHLARVYSHSNGPPLIASRNAVGIDLRGQWVRLHDCHAWGNDLTGIRCRDTHLFEVVAHGCTANDNGADGIQVDGAASPIAYKFYGCYANDNVESGFDVRLGPTSLFDCYATGNGAHGAFQQVTASVLNIIGGQYTGNGNDGVATLVADAVLNISGGAIVDMNDRHGVNFRGSRLIAEGIIAKNNGQTTAGRGLVVDGANTIAYWSIKGCQLFDDQGVKTQTHGVQFAASPPAGVLFGNDLAGNLTGEITGTVPAGTLRQAATTDFSGLVELATDAETITGTDTARAITPANLTAAGVKQGKHAKFFSAAEFIPRITNGPSRGLTETSTNDAMLDTLDFDQTTQEGATLFYKPPKSWDRGPITFVAYWTADAGSAAETFELELDAVAVSNDDALDVAWGTAVGVSDALIATGDLHISAESTAVTVGGSPALGDGILIRIKRDVANDNLAADARLLGVEGFFTTNAANDA